MNRDRYITLYIKECYYITTMGWYEYSHIQLEDILEEIIKQHNLRKIAFNGWIYTETRKGMPRIKQSGKVVHNWLKNHLAKFDYILCNHPPPLCTHKI